MRLLAIAAASVLLISAGCGWDPPVSDNPLSAPPLVNGISGSVVFAGNTPPAQTFVTVYSADNPGPPAGTGGPITFSSVPAHAFTGDGAGLQSAPFAITQLPDGAYLVNALVDRDRDFSPLSSSLAGATCGDWGGTHVTDLVTLGSAAVTVADGQLKDDVTVFVGQEFTLERPAFSFPDGPPTVSKAAAAGPLPPRFRIEAARIDTAFAADLPLALGPACSVETDLPPGACETLAACPCEIDGLPACASALWLWMVDDDGDGLVDPYPAEAQAASGLLNIWPRVFLESMSEDLPMFEYEGQMLPERWVSEAFPLAVDIWLAAANGGGPANFGPIGVPFPLAALDVSASPVFRHYHARGQLGVDANGPFDLVDTRNGGGGPVPTGAWSATVMSFTGQTWTLPNDIGLIPLPSTAPAEFDPATQAAVITYAP